MSEEQDIDRRLRGIIESLKLLEARQEHYAAEQERLDKRERNAREALLSGIAAYLRALNGGTQ